MKKLLKNSTFYLFRLMFRLAHTGVIGAIIFKGVFILLQVIAVWMMISWISGSMLPAVKDIVQLDDSSYVYLAIAWLVMVSSSVSAFFSRWLALRSIRRLEIHIFELTQGSGLVVSDYRNLSKVMLAITDAFVPIIFICGVSLVWLVKIPELMLPFMVLVILLALFFRKVVRFSAFTFKNKGRRVKPEEYIGSNEHQNFYQILMVSQYISLAIYTLIATGIVATLVLIHSFSNNLLNLGLLPVATALALLQFKSFVSLLVRLGAYASNASRVARLVISLSR